ncbi:MAG: carbohydrate ABC transporter permease [Defluviitaleaceae bacterium]|jgi:ABC-type glycerol-3-phosphate transport system permease component|nr:carbohydrate ABC transporter permease [Defluviitaleaceae bacterium]
MRDKVSPSRVVQFLFVTFYAVVSIVPIIFIINHAFKPFSELFLFPPQFFVRNPTFNNFRELAFAVNLSAVPFSRYLLNSILVTVATVFLTVLISTMGAYPLSKIKFRGRALIFSTIVLSLMFDPSAVGITRFLIVSNLGITNTYFGHILPLLAAPMSVFLIKQFMDQIPNTLSEAAKIDGASEWMIFSKIVIPNIKPAIGTAAVLSFQAAWGNAETSRLYMTSESMNTLPFFIETLNAGLQGGAAVARQGASAASTLLMFLPNIVIFIILQKSMMSTMVNSGIK